MVKLDEKAAAAVLCCAVFLVCMCATIYTHTLALPFICILVLLTNQMCVCVRAKECDWKMEESERKAE